MNSKLTLTESMSELRHKLLTIEQQDINEGILTRLLKMAGIKDIEKEIIKDLGEKVTITNAKGQKEVWTLRQDDGGVKYHLEGGDARISPENMKGRKANEPRNEPSLPPEVTEPHPTLLGPDGKPLQVPAKPKTAITDPGVKAIENMPISTDHPDITNMGKASEFLIKTRPNAMQTLSKNPEVSKRFWNAVVEKTNASKPGKKTVITVAALIALLLWYANKAEKDTTANAGSKTATEGESPIGTEIPADQIPWKWVVTGSNDPTAIDSIKNAKETYESLKSQSVSKNENGKWTATNGRILRNTGPTSARLEQLAKMDPEKRKEMAKAENTLTFNNVELYSPSVDGPALPVVTPIAADTANREPDVTNPEIVLATSGKCPAGYVLSKDGKTCEKEDLTKKKKKKDEKILPASKW